MAEEQRNALPKGYEIEGYRIRRVLGAGGFGITYLASETAIEREVAIKEFLPIGIAMRGKDSVSVHVIRASDQDAYEYGLDRFADEARILVRFDHPNIVTVHRFFEANGTAYMVMAYEKGQSLTARLKPDKTLAEHELLNILMPLLDGLEGIHAAGFLHRDIKPANIYLRADGTPVLLDFGSARQALGERSRSLTAIVTAGYAPHEQYSTRGNLGTWTDIYSLGAVSYRAIAGKPPPEAVDRATNDPYVPLARSAAGRYDPALLAAIDTALAFDPEDRPQSVGEWRRMLAGAAPAVPPAPTRPPTGARPRPLTVIAVIAVLALVTVAGVLITWTTSEEEAQKQPVAADSAAKRKAEAEAEKKAADEARRKAEADDLAWQQAAKDKSRSGYEKYLRRYPAGRHAEEARKAIAALERAPPPGKVIRDCRGCPEMVVIPAGSFMMGGLIETPVHRVRVKAFAIGKYEVTFAEYDACVAAGGCNGHRPKDEGWGRGRRPVINVSWNHAKAYVSWLSRKTGKRYRLPSEAEWEYAARAGTTTAYHWGDGIGRNNANCGGCGSRWDNRRTAPVGSFRPNRFGLHDVLGNLTEWVEDCWHPNYSGAPSDGRAWTSAGCGKRIFRGGTFGSKPLTIRSASRFGYDPALRGSIAGFRVARTF